MARTRPNYFLILAICASLFLGCVGGAVFVTIRNSMLDAGRFPLQIRDVDATTIDSENVRLEFKFLMPKDGFITMLQVKDGKVVEIPTSFTERIYCETDEVNVVKNVYAIKGSVVLVLATQTKPPSDFTKRLASDIEVAHPDDMNSGILSVLTFWCLERGGHKWAATTELRIDDK